jgi:hypothetical protein
MPVVVVGIIGCWVATGGGLPLAGNLQAVTATAIIASSAQVKMIFFFMVASLAPLHVSYADILHHFIIRLGSFRCCWEGRMAYAS